MVAVVPRWLRLTATLDADHPSCGDLRCGVPPWQAIDTDCSGAINFSEFTKWFQDEGSPRKALRCPTLLRSYLPPAAAAAVVLPAPIASVAPVPCLRKLTPHAAMPPSTLLLVRHDPRPSGYCGQPLAHAPAAPHAWSQRSSHRWSRRTQPKRCVRGSRRVAHAQAAENKGKKRRKKNKAKKKHSRLGSVDSTRRPSPHRLPSHTVTVSYSYSLERLDSPPFPALLRAGFVRCLHAQASCAELEPPPPPSMTTSPSGRSSR